jgi:uncharacterized membrane protein
VVTKRFGAVAMPIAVGALIAGLPLGIVYAGLMVVMNVGASELDPDVLSLVMPVGAGLGGLVYLLVAAYMAGGFVTLSLKAARGQPTAFGDIFSGGRYLGSFIVAAIVGGIVVSIGYVLCVIPGLILIYGLSLTSCLIVDQNMSGVDALKRSWEMTKGHKMTIFLFNLIGAGVMFLGELACFIGLILVSVPMLVVANAYVYLRIKGENPPAPT